MDILIPEAKVPLLAQADIVVCGGGCAGVTAAIAAARHGASVILLERWPSVGGMATNALVNGWHRSDRQKMVIYGLVEESAQRAQKHGWIKQDPSYPHAHETHWFDPEGMRIVWHDMLDEARVRTVCNLVAGPPVVDGKNIRAVLCDTKLGRRAVTGKIFIDATGDGDLAAQAGCPFSFGRPSDGRVQGCTLIFRLCGIDHQAAQQAGPAAAQRVQALMAQLRDAGKFPPFNERITAYYLGIADDRALWNYCPVAGNPLDAEELTRMTVQARRQIVAYLDLWRQEMPGYQNATLGQTAFSLGIRESRRIHGRKTLDANLVLDAVKQPDAVGHGVWMVDIHDPKGSGYTTWHDRGTNNRLPEGQSYHIPLGMALNDTIDNLAVVGRCASSTHEGHSSFRVQTHCMVLAQGVGTAAALALAADANLADVPLPQLQATLKADGVYLEDVPRAPGEPPRK